MEAMKEDTTMAELDRLAIGRRQGRGRPQFFGLRLKGRETAPFALKAKLDRWDLFVLVDTLANQPTQSSPQAIARNPAE